MGTLFVVATPIGNLGDMTIRAIETLKNVDIVLCEDTRNTQKLLNHFDIKTKTRSFHQHSSESEMQDILDLLTGEMSCALVTDAGTPGISDPGGRLVEAALKQGIPVHSTPGVSAVVTALSISGFPAEHFTFLGFPPQKNKRASFIDKAVEIGHTTVLYESNHRIKKLLSELSERLPQEREICVCRELTKLYESTYRGTMTEIMAMNIPEKGEFAVVIGPIR